ncbi:MAG: DUF2309 domain-containing protein [Pirellulales bacterium]|nr:DUF2309 domain-containing protein [Pirellulales bacterium]
MQEASKLASGHVSSEAHSLQAHSLSELIEHATHVLPSQGPISVFVHHNTLHALEQLRFDQAVLEGLKVYGGQPYLPESAYRQMVAQGRIRTTDIAAVLLDDLQDSADELIGFMGTRYALRRAMLEYPLLFGSDAETRWLIAEGDALRCFRPETPEPLRRQAIEEARGWVMVYLHAGREQVDHHIRGAVDELLHTFGTASIESWSEDRWESLTLHLLWRICMHGVHGVPRIETHQPLVRHRDVLWQARGRDIDLLVNPLLIQFCAAFLDQGFAIWQVPRRDAGFLESFKAVHGHSRWFDAGWLRDLPAELAQIESSREGALASIKRSLELLGVEPGEAGDYIQETLLALPGWAGMLWQMETNAEWTVRPAPPGSLVEYLAVRLVLERLALRHYVPEARRGAIELRRLRKYLRRTQPREPRVHVEQRAHLVFQLAQLRGWSLRELLSMSKPQWTCLVQEIESFPGLERRRILHLAFERRYRTQALDALYMHSSRPLPPVEQPTSFQLVTCIDDREESFRRHLEEVDPRCVTYAMAGFFAVAMYYRGAADAHYRPLCPVVIKPKHFVREEPAYSLRAANRQRAQTRRVLGTASHRWHLQSRSFLGGFLTALFGSLASMPLVARIMFPRITAQLRRAFGEFVQPPPVTELTLLRYQDPPNQEPEHHGYSCDEMVACVERVLRDIGLTHDFARIVIVLGHGSSSLNNPHESAYNCGACSGGLGGPNARAITKMANDPVVRERLAEHGLLIPDDTVFVGGFHNTCTDEVTYFDLDSIPVPHRAEFEAATAAIDEARARNAHERIRRFVSADLSLTSAHALDHVHERSEDLSQARPEYNHATNAMCIVGRRSRTRGLFLDRRAFLSDYDPTQDDEQASILARILAPAIPVCAGISLEYYFSCVDPAVYGCGSKLPHNIVSLLGVMEGAATDLRPGLSQQMIEIHEPLRILFVIETTPEVMLRLIDANPVIGQLIRNEWVQLATLSPDGPTIHVYERGVFKEYEVEDGELPKVARSLDWYRGRRGHLGIAVIEPEPENRGNGVTEGALHGS